MPVEVSTSFLNKLQNKRDEVRASAEQLLVRAKAAGRDELLENEPR